MSEKLFRALDSAIADLSRLLESEGTELVHEGMLRKALRELKVYRKGGKQPSRRLHRAVELISRVLREEFVKRAKNAR